MKQQYILLFLAILIIISGVVFFVFYKKDEEESSPSPSPSPSNKGNSPSKEDKIAVKITDDGVYVPDLPTKENYTQNEMPCDDKINKDDMSPAPISDTVKEWCEDLGIPINKNYEVVGYSYDDSLSSNMYSMASRDIIFSKHKDIGCKYGGDKKGCVYVEKRVGTDEGKHDGNITGIQNYKGDNFLEIFWDGLSTHTKMRDFFKDEIFINMEIKVENNKLYVRPKATPQNCADFTGKWYLMKPGINIPTVLGMQMIILFLHIKGYQKDQVTFEMDINALSNEEIDANMSEEMDKLNKDPDDGGEDMCTDDIVYIPYVKDEEDAGTYSNPHQGTMINTEEDTGTYSNPHQGTTINTEE